MILLIIEFNFYMIEFILDYGNEFFFF